MHSTDSKVTKDALLSLKIASEASVHTHYKSKTRWPWTHLDPLPVGLCDIERQPGVDGLSAGAHSGVADGAAEEAEAVVGLQVAGQVDLELQRVQHGRPADQRATDQAQPHLAYKQMQQGRWHIQYSCCCWSLLYGL